jgi:hypothetical protein
MSMGTSTPHRKLRTREDGQPNPNYVDWGRGTRPVVGVSWFDAQAFAGWLNWKTGEDDAYRLPAEAEWEYAARAGTTTAYPWGAKLDHNYGNFGIPGPGLGGKAEGRDQWADQTAPVASFPANAFGLYDMHGNVFEWVEDCYEADRAHAPADGSANKQGNCANRVFRDGTFMSNPHAALDPGGLRIRRHAGDGSTWASGSLSSTEGACMRRHRLIGLCDCRPGRRAAVRQRQGSRAAAPSPRDAAEGLRGPGDVRGRGHRHDASISCRDHRCLRLL